MAGPRFIYPLSVDGHLGFCRLLAVVSNVAANIHTQVFAQIHVFIFLRCVPRSEIAG